jgi:phosphatidylserine synthase
MESTGSGCTTVKVTGMFTGVEAPVTLATMVALYVPAARLVGLTRTLSVVFSFPLVGFAVNHSVPTPVIAMPNDGVPVLARRLTVWAAGSVATPGW